MAIDFPATCRTEGSRMSFCIRVKEKLRIIHNKLGARTKRETTDPLFIPLDKSVVIEIWSTLTPSHRTRIMEDLHGAKSFREWQRHGSYKRRFNIMYESYHIEEEKANNANYTEGSPTWSVDKEKVIIDGKIVYPVELNINNEGSKLSFLRRLGQLFTNDKIEIIGDPKYEDFINEITTTEEEAKSNTLWDKDIDIDVI